MHDINAQKPTWNIVGILDDDEGKKYSTHYREVEVLGVSGDIRKHISDNTFFLISFCSVKSFLYREEYIIHLKREYPRIHFANVIHPSACISPSARMGEGNFLANNVIVDAKATLGNHTIVLFNSVVSRFVTVGDYCFLSANVNIMGNVNIGNTNFLGVKSTITKNIKDHILVNSGALVQKHIESNSIVSNHGSSITSYRSKEKLKRMLMSL